MALLSFLLEGGGEAALIRSNGTILGRHELEDRVGALAAQLPGGLTAVIAADPAEMVIGVLAAMARGAAAPGSSRTSSQAWLARLRPAAVIRDGVVVIAGDSGCAPEPSAGAPHLSAAAHTASVAAADASAAPTPSFGVAPIAPPGGGAIHRAMQQSPSGTGAPDSRGLDPEVSLILSTSGSAGVPKDVLLSGAGLRANILAILDYLPIHGRPAVVLPPWYGYALIGQVFASLRAGGTPILLSDVAYGADQAARMRDLGADSLSSVASSLRWLADAGLPPLRFVASAGEPLPRSTADKLQAGHLYNQYGLTEASPRVTAIRSDDPAFWEGSVGRPIRGVTVEAGTREEPAPVLVSSPSVMVGYLDGTTAVEDGWLRTGDLGWLDPEGRLYLTGREDDIVKVAGERVSLIGVEHALLAAGARAACVVALPSLRTGNAVGAAIVAEDPQAVRAAMRESLAPHQRPTRWLVLPEIPTAANGKPDRPEVRRLLG